MTAGEKLIAKGTKVATCPHCGRARAMKTCPFEACRKKKAALAWIEVWGVTIPDGRTA